MLSANLCGLLLAMAPAAPAAEDHETVIKEFLKITTELCDVMDKVKDKKTAEDNKDKLKALAAKMKDSKARLDKLGAPPKELEKKLTEQYLPELLKLVPRLQEASKKIMQPDIKGVLGDINLQLM